MSDKLIEYYEGYYKSLGTEAYTGDRVVHTSRMFQFRDWVNSNVPKGGRILDIGCGSATFSAMCPDYEWHGVDINLEACQGKPIKAVVWNIEKTPYPYEAGSFDAITCSEVLEHIFDPISIHKEAKRLLKREGVYMISTPNHMWVQNLIRCFENLVYDHEKPWTKEHIHTYTYESHQKCLAEAGFGVEQRVGADFHYCGIFRPAIVKIIHELQIRGFSVDEGTIGQWVGQGAPDLAHTAMLLAKKV
jgi:SAM-dependent methyltransferase